MDHRLCSVWPGKATPGVFGVGAAISFLFDSSSTGQKATDNQVEDKEGEEGGRGLSPSGGGQQPHGRFAFF